MILQFQAIIQKARLIPLMDNDVDWVDYLNEFVANPTNSFW